MWPECGHKSGFWVDFLFWKLVDETQISKPPEATRYHNSIKLLILLPLRADLLMSVHSETSCTCNPHKFEIPALRFPCRVPVIPCKHLQCSRDWFMDYSQTTVIWVLTWLRIANYIHTKKEFGTWKKILLREIHLQLREYWKDLEYRLHHRLSKFDRSVFLI